MGEGGNGGAEPIDAAGFERLFRAHADRIFRFCLRRTGDWALADDLRSAVFYEAWRRRGEVDLATREALPWLYGVATNVIRNQRRSLRRQEAAIKRLPPPLENFDTTDDIAERLDATTRGRRALRLVAALPPGERDVVRLCLTRNWTYRAAARELGVPVGTVRSRLSRARARLHALDPGGDCPCDALHRRSA
ncbi:MAG: RNA polymerase sigma factor [Actinomycetota bacterium]|nr:RNA polymerase sigma factor [Actinomycetota bacterium]